MDDAYSHQASTPPDRSRKSALETMRNENMNFVDSNDVIVEYYKNQQASGLDRYFLEIEEWLEEDKTLHTNTPLVLEADDGIGKKTLLVKWMEYHARNKKGRYQDFIIPHFATQSGKNSNYYYAIYRILIKLREALNIKQKVELLEEKLRRYFQYWLEICSRQLEQQIINGAQVIYDKVILVFEGIDNFREILDMHREANVNFWLPKYFPTNIKVIVTAERQSSSMRLLKPDCQVIPIVSDKSVLKQMVNSHLSRHLFIQNFQPMLDIFIQLNYKVRNQPLFVRTFFSVFMPYPTEGIVEESEVDISEVQNILKSLTLNDLKNLRTVEELFKFIIDYFTKAKIISDNKISKVLLVLALTQKGLTYSEIESVCQINQQEWKMFSAFFKVFLMKHKELWIIHNEIFKKVVIDDFYNDPEEIRQLHDQIAYTIDKITPNSIRKLEEQTFQLFSARNHFSLKEVISIIENFLLLFNPQNKYDLCRYWQSLEENGFDPVLEYNKAIEGFQIHYHPSSEDMFRIIIQISRFLKEFGDFETKNTPKFRHPPIIGVLSDLYDIGLLQEILKLDLYYDKAPELKQFDVTKHLKRVARPLIAPVLTKLESLNVEIFQNRQEVREFFLQQLIKPQEQTENEDDKIDNIDFLAEELNYRLQKAIMNKEEQLLQEDNMQMDHESTDYYYKRWIWIQFPWACISIDKNCDYSKIIKQCFSSATDYMSVEDENAFTESALKIALEAKQKQKDMYEVHPFQQQRMLLIPQESVLEQKDFEQALKKQQKLEQLEISNSYSIKSSRFDRSTIPELPQLLSNRSAKASKIQLPHFMFITSDFMDAGNLNEETKSLQLGQNSISNDGKSTLMLLEASKVKKDRIRNFAASSIQHQLYSVTEIFPIVKNGIQDHSTKQLDLLNSQQKSMRMKLDQIIYQNQQLAKELKLLKIMDFNKGYLKREQQNKDSLLDLKDQLQKQIKYAEKEYKDSNLTKSRVIKILKICNDNKQQNEEYIRYLNLWTRNLAKLIKFEEQEIKKTQLNIQKGKRQFNEFYNTYKVKRNNQKNLIQEIKVSLYQKKLLDKQFQQSDVYISEKANQSIKNLRAKLTKKEADSKNKKAKETKEKESKNLIEKLEQLNAKYELIKDVFDIKIHNYNQSVKFIDFLAQKDRKSEYEIKFSECRQKLQEVQENNRKLNEQLKTYQNAYQNLSPVQQQEVDVKENQSEKSNFNIQLKEQQLKKLIQLEASLSSAIDLQQSKCGCNTIEDICKILETRKQLIIKNVEQKGYNDVITFKYDSEQIMKQNAPFVFPRRYTVRGTSVHSDN